tara:strand:- start:1340 stop:1654 length:315 start_codon:yes stop_codon:yes gene_type:complete
MTKESLIKIRKSLGVSQVVFAEMLGYSSAVRINEFEKGTRPITKQLEMTCHYLRLLVIKGLEYKTSKAFMQIQEIKELFDKHDHILETDVMFVDRCQRIVFDIE